MASFVHPNLFWLLGLPTLGVVAIPVLIHLINMMRHRRVEWAAMEFLLISQKKHRTWIILKQLLLLLMRMAAVAAVVLLVAQPRLRSEWGSWLGGIRTHHIVLLDDSFSMSDRWGDTDAFSEAKKVVKRIGEGTGRQEGAQSFTLVRFSKVGRAQRNSEPDLVKQTVDSEFLGKLDALLGKMKVTESAAGPEPALQAMRQLLGASEGEHRILYLVSDFRTRQWNEPTELRKELRELSEAGTEIRLIGCADRARPNVAIASLQPAEGIRAAGVEWPMEVVVENFGDRVLRKVPVTLSEDAQGRPSLVIEEIGPRKSVRQQFGVNFSHAGAHRITARLESDTVAADNYRFCAVDLPPDLPVLLVDSDPQGRSVHHLSIALSPGGSEKTGIRPQVELPRYLSLKPLANFAAVNLANIDRLESSAVTALEKYVASGGGVAFFLGDHTDVRFFNDALYRDGNGLLPAPLGRQAELLVDRLEPSPDVQFDEADPHFIFRRQKNALSTVAVRRYFAVREGWQPKHDPAVRVAAQLRNGAPLVLERRFGKGRVMLFLTGAEPRWNNWAKTLSFVPAMQDLQAYLTHRADQLQSLLVGTPLEVRLEPTVYQPHVHFAFPEEAAPPAAVNAVRGSDGMLTATLPETDFSGFYEAQLTRADNTMEMRRYAVNVDAAEGDLNLLTGPQLAPRLEGVKYEYERAASFQSAANELAGYNLSDVILAGLILLLIGEQIFAWSASYHPSRRSVLVEGNAA